MSDLSQYQNVFRLAKNGSPSTGQGRAPRVTKRSRQPVSCTSCRARKLKCNRHVPCMACSKKGDAASCQYSKTGTDASDSGSKTSEAHSRLEKLEQMVTSLMHTTSSGPANHINLNSSHSATVEQSMNGLSLQSLPNAPSLGHLDTSGSQTKYLGATHWATILENIHEIQGHLEPETDEESEESPDVFLSHRPDIALEKNSCLTLSDLFQRVILPQSSVATSSSRYVLTSKAIIHRPKFLREYESFRKDPSNPSVSFLWISMLFSILWLGSQLEHSQRDQAFESSSEYSTFLVTAGKALIAGGYRKARTYSVEAVILYGQCHWMAKEDPDEEAWMLMGVSARLALKMGYHRDPRHLKNISPFEGEMRRRVFQVVEIFDLLMSFQAGLPAIIREEDCDTDPPSNLFDEDFDEDCVVLPPSRPLTDMTQMLYYSYKGKFSKIFGRIIRNALSPKKSPYEETMRLDNELQIAHTEVPPSLRIKLLQSSFTEPPHLIMNRLNIQLMYLKCVCVLHRNYLTQERSNPAFAYSREICLDAALQIVRHQADIYASSQPGGRFFGEKWILSNLTLHDFLLAAMITCLDLWEANKASSTAAIDLEGQIKKWDALQLSQEIWLSRRAFSRDARRASNVLAIMLAKIPKPKMTGTSAIANQAFSEFSQYSVNGDSSGESYQNHPSISSHESQSFEDSQTGFYLRSFDPSNLNAKERLNTILDESETIDWAMLDQYIIDPDNINDVSIDVDWDILDPSPSKP